MTKPYLSWSEVYSFTKDQNGYYQEYILGIKPEPSEAMILGNLIHQAIAGQVDIEKALKNNNFTSDYIRTGRKLVDAIKPLINVRFQELAVIAQPEDGTGVTASILGIYDALDPVQNQIIEFKTTKNGWTSQEDVDENGQITLYSLIYKELTGTIPTTVLYRLDVSNGKIKKYETERNQKQLDEMKSKLNEIHAELVFKGWWPRREMKTNFMVDKAKKGTKKLLSYVKPIKPTLISV